jgi:ABC-type glycerol-3-phosphate transport system substrate-binding protein
MKRIMWFLSLIALLSFVLSGCAGSEETTKSVKSKTLTFWVFNNPPMVEKTKKLIKVYEDEHPNIKIDLQVMPNDQYSQKYTVALGTQTGPDVLLLSDRSIPTLTEKGVLAPINPKAFGFDNIEKLKSF